MPGFLKVFIFFILIFISALFFSCRSEKGDTVKTDAECQRIASTAPSITETLFALGLGSRVVAVSSNCTFPDEVSGISKVGKVLDLSYEAILLSKPDTVILSDYNASRALNLERAGIRTIVVDHSNLYGFIDSIDTIARECKKEEIAVKMRKKFESALSEREARTVETSPEVLIVVGREYLEKGIKDIYVAGRDRFYDEILKIFNLNNSYKGKLSYPKIQVEGLMTMDPDIIIEVITDRSYSIKDLEKIRKEWQSLKNVKAVSSDKVFVVNKDYWSIPGPRFVKIVTDLQEIISSEKGMAIK